MFNSNLTIIFTAIFFKLSTAATPASVDQWVVWNVDQGQWVTHVLTEACIHYDIGGELGTFKNVRRRFTEVCATKKNFVLLSHWDFDHYINLLQVIKVTRDICWLQQPPLSRVNKSIMSVLELNISRCQSRPPVKIWQWSPSQGRTSNEYSNVNLDQGFLMSGDSPMQKEKIWSHELQHITDTKVLVLGHHGSRTSTGIELLQHLPNLKMAVASARRKKYGHPHKETLARLAKNKTPVLKTEDWGSIWFL